MRRYADMIYNATVGTQCNGFPIDEAVDVAVKWIKAPRTVFLVGNGGSLAACDHMANDLCLAGVKAVSLSNAANMACIANDFGFAQTFRRQLHWLKDDDFLLIGLSCSGNSENVIEAVKYAKDVSAPVMTFTGFQPDNRLRSIGDLNFYVPSNSYGVVQLAHEALLHCIIDKIARLY